jgi:hypothetical protein
MLQEAQGKGLVERSHQVDQIRNEWKCLATSANGRADGQRVGTVR